MERCNINRSTSISKSFVDASKMRQGDFVTFFIFNTERCPLLLVPKVDVSKSKIGVILMSAK